MLTYISCIVFVYLSMRIFAIWILPQVVASCRGVEYLGKSIWFTSSPKFSLSKTSSKLPAIAASLRFFDISVNLSVFKPPCSFYYKKQILKLSVSDFLARSATTSQFACIFETDPKCASRADSHFLNSEWPKSDGARRDTCWILHFLVQTRVHTFGYTLPAVRCMRLFYSFFHFLHRNNAFFVFVVS